MFTIVSVDRRQKTAYLIDTGRRVEAAEVARDLVQRPFPIQKPHTTEDQRHEVPSE
jgi:hypothetical protein